MKDYAWKKKDFKNGGQYSRERTPDSHMCNSLGKIEYREIRQGMDPLLIIDEEKATVVLYFLKEKVWCVDIGVWLDLKLENLTQGRNKNFSKEHPVGHCVCVCVCVGLLYQRERKGEVQHELRTIEKVFKFKFLLRSQK